MLDMFKIVIFFYLWEIYHAWLFDIWLKYQRCTLKHIKIRKLGINRLFWISPNFQPIEFNDLMMTHKALIIDLCWSPVPNVPLKGVPIIFHSHPE